MIYYMAGTDILYDILHRGQVYTISYTALGAGIHYLIYYMGACIYYMIYYMVAWIHYIIYYVRQGYTI